MEPLDRPSNRARGGSSTHCGNFSSLTRRNFLAQVGMGTAWMTVASQVLAQQAEEPANRRAPARSIIMLWLDGGPSQLETFDPHPNTEIAAGSTAIDSAVRGIQLGAGLPRTAEEMQTISIVRSMVSKEGDHERAAYTMKTGFVPDPTVVHPSIGAILCHQLPEAGTEIPRHISILPGQWPARGGYLGDQYDAFRTYDPANPVPDTRSFSSPERDASRLSSLEVIERSFSRGRRNRVESTLHRDTVGRARRMMNSDQLRAFDLSSESADLKRSYGDTPFGRACLAARRLIEVGVRCVEVSLGGWDTHANNHALVRDNLTILDPAFSTLIRDLRERRLLDHTIVFCGGEFGRTPRVNPVGGRDHWPNGFSVALAGGGFRGGFVLGETDPEGRAGPPDPIDVSRLHATMLTLAGIDASRINQTAIGRTVPFSSGEPIPQLMRDR